MTLEEFKTLMDEYVTPAWKGDNFIPGLAIICKYKDPRCGVDAKELVEAGITEDDARELRRLNWMLDKNGILACFV